MLTWYYQKTNERFQKRLMKSTKIFLKYKKRKEIQKRQYASERYRNLSKEEKEKKSQYCGEWYKRVKENEKQNSVEYINNNSKM